MDHLCVIIPQSIRRAVTEAEFKAAFIGRTIFGVISGIVRTLSEDRKQSSKIRTHSGLVIPIKTQLLSEILLFFS